MKSTSLEAPHPTMTLLCVLAGAEAALVQHRPSPPPPPPLPPELSGPCGLVPCPSSGSSPRLTLTAPRLPGPPLPCPILPSTPQTIPGCARSPRDESNTKGNRPKLGFTFLDPGRLMAGITTLPQPQGNRIHQPHCPEAAETPHGATAIQLPHQSFPSTSTSSLPFNFHLIPSHSSLASPWEFPLPKQEN